MAVSFRECMGKSKMDAREGGWKKHFNYCNKYINIYVSYNPPV